MRSDKIGFSNKLKVILTSFRSGFRHSAALRSYEVTSQKAKKTQDSRDLNPDTEFDLAGGEDIVVRFLRIGDRDVVWLRSVIEAYNGLANLYGDGSGIVRLISPLARETELDALLDDLESEIKLERL